MKTDEAIGILTLMKYECQKDYAMKPLAEALEIAINKLTASMVMEILRFTKGEYDE